MSAEELAESIRWRPSSLSFDINDVNLDYVILEARAETMDVLLVAVKKDKIGDYTSVISGRKTPALVDVDAFALQKARSEHPIEPARVCPKWRIKRFLSGVNVLSSQHDLLARRSPSAEISTPTRSKQLARLRAEGLRGARLAPTIRWDILPILRRS
jgi:Tfp pilus assembly PilM family ATPase